MPLDTEATIRQRAYEIWESENRPQGRDKEHWEAAARELAAKPVKRKPATVAAAPAKRARAK